jgi:hypothetical protein
VTHLPALLTELTERGNGKRLCLITCLRDHVARGRSGEAPVGQAVEFSLSTGVDLQPWT